MTKKLRVVILVLALLILSLVMWYTRPLSISELAFSPEPSPVFAFIRRGCIAEDGSPDIERLSLKLQPGEPLYEELTGLLEEIRIRRSLTDFLPERPARGAAIKEGECTWTMDLPLASFHLQYFDGHFTYSLNDKRGYRDCSVLDSEDTAAELTAFLLKNSTKTD